MRERTRGDRKKGSVRGEDGNQGAYWHFLWHIGGFFTTIACFGSIMWPLSIPVYQEQKKGDLLMAAVIFARDSLGPLFDLANVVYPRLQFASRIQAFLPTIAYSHYEWQRAWDKPILDCVDHIIEKINVHAHTEGKLQVELAALMYMETRLAREPGPDGCYTFGAVGETEVVNAQGGD